MQATVHPDGRLVVGGNTITSVESVDEMDFVDEVDTGSTHAEAFVRSGLIADYVP